MLVHWSKVYLAVWLDHRNAFRACILSLVWAPIAEDHKLNLSVRFQTVEAAQIMIKRQWVYTMFKLI